MAPVPSVVLHCQPEQEGKLKMIISSPVLVSSLSPFFFLNFVDFSFIYRYYYY